LRYDGTAWINSFLPTSDRTLEGLYDVDVETRTDGQFLMWDGDVSLWINANVPTADVNKAYVDGSLALRDTSIAWLNTNKANTSALASYTLKTYVDGSLALRDTSIAWLNTNKTSFTYVDGSLNVRTTKTYVDGSLSLRDTSIAWLNTNKASSTHTHTLNSLTDVIVDTAANGDFLQYNGTNWVPQAIAAGPTTLAALTDTTITSPGSGQFLRYNGTAWVNAVIAASDISSGTLPTARGGTNQTTWTANRLTYSNSTTQLSSLAAITASRAIVSNASGLPVHATTTSTQIGYLSTLSSDVQDQLNAKANAAHTHPIGDLTAGSASNNNFIMFYGTAWTLGELTAGTGITLTKSSTGIQITSSGGSGSSTLAGLTDVDVDTASNNQYLRYDTATTKWLNSTIDAAHIGSGTLGTARGGTNQTTWTANRLAYANSTTQLSALAAITANRALISNASGLPTHANTTATEIGYVNGVTSAIQTQLNDRTTKAYVDGSLGTRALTTYVDGSLNAKVDKLVSISEKTAAYTLAATDNQTVIRVNSSSALTMTVGTAFAGTIGRTCTIIRQGTGEVTIGTSSTTRFSEGSKTRIGNQYGAVTVIVYAANTFFLVGDLKT
jgi:hypothetical protein